MLAIARALLGVAAREHGAVVADEVPRRGRDLRLGSLGVGTRSLDGHREGEESDDGEQGSAHHRRANS